ncbi:MAG: hypothetical protein OEY01_16390 [Desulfobulbaceae bacterium]|nr:hypothetical protein [Desulfobulbaceae bacterium]
MEKSFASKILEICKELAKAQAEFTTTDVAHKAFVQTATEHKKVLHALTDMTNAGKLDRVSRGVYAMPKSLQREPQIQEKMWRLFRAKRKVTRADIVELTGASEMYAKEFFKMLVDNGVAKDLGGQIYQLIKDPVEMPRNEEKADRYRRMRLKHKQALEQLDQADAKIIEAQAAVNAARGIIQNINE